MSDFTKIDHRIHLALEAALPELKLLFSQIPPVIMLEPCLPVLKQLALVIFSAGVEAADETLLASADFREYLIESILGDRQRTRVFEQTRVARNVILAEYQRVSETPEDGAHRETYVAPNAEEDRWMVAPAVVKVVDEPFGQWERLAPSDSRFALRPHMGRARQALIVLYEEVEQRRLARRLAGSGAEGATDTTKGRKNGTIVNGKKLKECRGSVSQEGLAATCQVSVDTIQRGESNGRWSDATFKSVTDGIRKTGILITEEDLKKR